MNNKAKTNIQNKYTKAIWASVAIVVAFTLLIGPMVSDLDAFACKDKHKDKKEGGGNKSKQEINQSQSSNQSSQVVSGGDTNNSGNNSNDQSQSNEGNNAIAQQ